ncbi:linear amide C-N hydrolase [Caldithrix abyssi]
MMRAIFVFCVLILGGIGQALGCTTFVLQDSAQIVFGRNFDYDLGMGLVVVNKRGLEKQAMTDAARQPARWTAQYGSVTFNQAGIDAPMGGMNEKGLVIAQMALPETIYPQTDGKPVLNQLEWIQYQLDISATSEEVIANSLKVAIVPVATPVHYLICDAEGRVAVIEFLNGKMMVRQGKDVVVPVCSNWPYEKSISALGEYREFGGHKPIPQRWTSIADIVAIAAFGAKNFHNVKNEKSLRYGFDLLSKLESAERTQWSVIYDITNRRIYFTSLRNKKRRNIYLERIDFSCDAAIPVADVQEHSAANDSLLLFGNLEKEEYFRYKKELVSWFKTHIAGFPELPDIFLNREVESVFNRPCAH